MPKSKIVVLTVLSKGPNQAQLLHVCIDRAIEIAKMWNSKH